MQRKLFVALLALWAADAHAQRATLGNDDSKQATIASDPGRSIADDRGGLAGRGGNNPAGSQHTFSATIGSTIYSTIGTPISSTLPSKPK